MKTMPTRRDVKVNFNADIIDNWHSNGRVTTHFLNTLSTLFPHGERFFMDSVRAYRDQIKDPELQKAVTAFIGQEAMHSREHLKYNRALDDKGLPGTKIQEQTGRLIKFFSSRMGRKGNMAGTLALEHYTALLGEIFLKNEDFVGKASDPKFAQMWTWHALEETEHKAVAYDVWDHVYENDLRTYLARTSTMAITSAVFLTALAYFHAQMVLADEKTKGERIKGYIALGKVLFAKDKPSIRTYLPQFFDYFRRDFHPWMHDNSASISRIDEQVQEIAQKVA